MSIVFLRSMHHVQVLRDVKHCHHLHSCCRLRFVGNPLCSYHFFFCVSWALPTQLSLSDSADVPGQCQKEDHYARRRRSTHTQSVVLTCVVNSMTNLRPSITRVRSSAGLHRSEDVPDATGGNLTFSPPNGSSEEKSQPTWTYRH